MQQYSLTLRPEGSPRGGEGEQIHFLAEPRGLTPPYQFDLFIDDQPAGDPIRGNDRQRLWLSSRELGLHGFSVRVRDACDVETRGRIRFWVGPGGPPDSELAGPSAPAGRQGGPGDFQPGQPGVYQDDPGGDVDTDFEF